MTIDYKLHDGAPSSQVAPSHRAPSSVAPTSVQGSREKFRQEVVEGLTGPLKTLSPKWFYDRTGSALFDSICEQSEYYVTRTELSIVELHARGMVDRWGSSVRVVEPGAGSSTKTRLLLKALGPSRTASYVPVDISREHLTATAERLKREIPWLKVSPVCADFTADMPIPSSDEAGRTVVYFPGSTIGNFEPREAERLLARFRRAAGSNGLVVVGVDLKKDPALLHAAYNDHRGVTAAFNKNVLARMNRELDGDIDPESFAHYAFYEPRHGRMEMHLVSRTAQEIHVAGRRFHFDEGESIRTECSYKHDLRSFEQLARTAGLTQTAAWLDGERHFAVLELSPVR